jgi:hypothetical protein
MSHLIQTIDQEAPITHYAAVPNPWPDVFYLGWVLDLHGKSYVWTSVKQNLMADV